MLKGWDEQEMFQLSVQRKVAIIISETINRSMGGHGVVDQIMKAFELPADKQQHHFEWTSERISKKIAAYNAKMRERKNGNNN